MRLEKKTALIAGAGQGMGRAMALRFAAEGAAVTVWDLHEERAHDVATEIETAGGRALAVAGDALSKADVDANATAAENAFGPIDVLVNVAFLGLATEPPHEMSEEAWTGDLNGCVTGAFLCSQRVLPSMTERKAGSILNIASISALHFVGSDAYAAGKAAMISLTQGLAVRYGEHGVRTNAIAPGTIRTPALASIDVETLQPLIEFFPPGRMGEPEEVANAALFLVSDEASYVNGVVLRVDGGWLCGNVKLVREMPGL